MMYNACQFLPLPAISGAIVNRLMRANRIQQPQRCVHRGLLLIADVRRLRNAMEAVRLAEYSSSRLHTRTCDFYRGHPLSANQA
jgi:hypothetical protein